MYKTNMEEEYNPILIEKKWRERWEKENRWRVDTKKAKRPYYNLMMFPYPSAEGLHVGNVYSFTAADIHGRYQRMRGNDVFEPMGFDAFGLNSENFALKKNMHPAELTAKNVRNFRSQMRQMGALFDWDYEIDTSKPEYYKWTQWLFLQLYKHGLAYRAKAAVDWCPGCKTVLADEQVISGKCERCDSIVVQKDLEQWFFRITSYADRLLNNLDGIDWSESVKLMQKNWIGRSIGSEITFQIRCSARNEADLTQTAAEKFQRNSALLPRNSATLAAVNVFTTRPDTLFGATYIVLAPEHELVDELKERIQNWDEVEAYRAQAQKKTALERTELQKEKTGIELKGVYALNPANKEKVSVWIADYVLGGYGTGAIMAVPAHDQRDFDFAKKFGLPIVMVICPHYPAPTCPIMDSAYTGDGHLVASGKFNGMKSEDAKEVIVEFVGGRKKISYHLRDWLISRQRYWGPPIPIVYCGSCGIVAVKEEDLPVLLPSVKDFHPTGTNKSPLASVEDFVNTTCPQCGGAARRETDVSDNFLDSSWYFLRYPSAHVSDVPFGAELTKKWLPVDMYIGGKEHSVLHLMYARFITMALKDFGHIDFEEPFSKFRAHGLLIKDGAKMSKSRGNVVNPDDFFASVGVDATRIYLMFLGPLEAGGDWRDDGILGSSRFLKRVWTLCMKEGEGGEKADTLFMRRLMHKTIKKVTDDIANLRYNTAISALMEYTNGLSPFKSGKDMFLESYKNLLIMLAPFAPHLAEELWEKICCIGSVHDQPWPSFDESLLVSQTVRMAVQINGKLRGIIEAPAEASEEDIKKIVLKNEKIAPLLGGQSSPIGGNAAKRWIIVPRKIVNIIV